MQMTDSRIIAADRNTVWAALLDADVLKNSVSGCEELTGSPSEGFEAVVVQKVGPVKARFTGTVTISDVDEGRSLTLTGEGKGGAAGFAKGAAHVTIEDAPLENGATGTRLSYEVEATVGGKLAQLGGRIIDGFARKMADDFFDRFQDAVESPDEDDTAASDEAENDAAPKKGWFKRLLGGD